MGAVRLFVMIVLVCGVVAWAIGQREHFADAAERLVRDGATVADRLKPGELPVETAGATTGATTGTTNGADEDSVAVLEPRNSGGGQTRIREEAAASEPARGTTGADHAGGAAQPDAGDDEVVIVRAGEQSGAGVSNHSGRRGLTLQASRDGHFYLKVRVNGAEIPFLVDTGASSVMLTREAARRARIHPRTNDYTMLAHTANGTVRMAPITVRDMRVGSFRVANVPGAVNKADSGISLLGMSFLRRLKKYEVKGDQLVLYW